MLSEAQIKALFFESDRPRENALIAAEVDIVQFAGHIETLVRAEAAREEHQRCVDIVSEMDPDIARALLRRGP
jgi:hypothetical protein